MATDGTTGGEKILPPELKKYMEKRLKLKLNGGRVVSGVLQGFDQFMNVVIDSTTEEVSATERREIGLVVIRGNSIVQIECLDRVFS
mmetsp:Transcript_14337/g.34193  ORF Transcript_14337/g.34193 Transcript_14337/m.34193 type:complete len:87 (+) Transcript_14337:263-523(+)